MTRMSTRGRRLAVLAGTVTLVAAGAAAPAHAGDTTTTFTLAGGSLAISQPASASLGSGNTGDALLSGSLGTVTVTDTRGALVANWTATASTTDFTTGAASSAETVGKANVAYAPGAPTASSGVAVFTPVPVASMTGTSTVYRATAAVGNNSVSWNPTIAITLPSAAVVGDYTGTITHSVS